MTRFFARSDFLDFRVLLRLSRSLSRFALLRTLSFFSMGHIFFFFFIIIIIYYFFLKIMGWV
jgi:hypothetical protein